MQYYRTTISHGTTGTKTVTPGFQPVAAKITVGSMFGATDSVNHLSMGNTNGTTSSYHSTFSDGSGHQTISGTGKLARHFDRVAGTITEVLTVDTPSFTATQFQYNVVTANANYQLHVEVWG
jgi:hypothetical protein